MTATSQDVIRFKARAPEFASLTDADVAAALDEADMWLDEDMWNPNDYPWARLWLAAHNLKLAMVYANPQDLDVGGVTGSVGMFVRSVAFGERRVQFGERKFSTSKTAGSKGSGEELLEETIYGNKFLQLRSRNIPGIITV